MTRVDEIRDRLDKATPGLGEIDGGEELQKRRGNPKGSYTWTLYGTYADAILLVNARDDLAWCLGEIERLEVLIASAWQEGYAARQADLGAADKTPNPYTSKEN